MYPQQPQEFYAVPPQQVDVQKLIETIRDCEDPQKYYAPSNPEYQAIQTLQNIVMAGSCDAAEQLIALRKAKPELADIFIPVTVQQSPFGQADVRYITREDVSRVREHQMQQREAKARFQAQQQQQLYLRQQAQQQQYQAAQQQAQQQQQEKDNRVAQMQWQLQQQQAQIQALLKQQQAQQPSVRRSQSTQPRRKNKKKKRSRQEQRPASMAPPSPQVKI